MRNIRLIIEYDGTSYHGWQIQSHHDTIQGRVREALQTMLKQAPVKFVGASRTDAGVHALAQVGNVVMPDDVNISCAALYHGLNSLTPNDINIKEVREMPPEFHARFDARGKTYCYQVVNARLAPIYHLRFSWHVRRPLDITLMRQAAKYLIGCHDFKSFQASSCGSDSSIRTVFGIHIWRRDHRIFFFIKANAYLHRMVRNIIGTFVDVGLGTIAPIDVLSILKAKDRRRAGVTAPAHGLFLVKVHY